MKTSKYPYSPVLCIHRLLKKWTCIKHFINIHHYQYLCIVIEYKYNIDIVGTLPKSSFSDNKLLLKLWHVSFGVFDILTYHKYYPLTNSHALSPSLSHSLIHAWMHAHSLTHEIQARISWFKQNTYSPAVHHCEKWKSAENNKYGTSLEPILVMIVQWNIAQLTEPPMAEMVLSDSCNIWITHSTEWGFFYKMGYVRLNIFYATRCALQALSSLISRYCTDRVFEFHITSHVLWWALTG